MIRENPIKQKLAAKLPVVGTFAKFSDPASVEILALAGMDFFVLDNEHVMLNRESMVHIIRAADACGIAPIIRVRANSAVEILQVLDSGAIGVMVPQVNSAAEAKACVNAVKYAPQGNRGFAPTHRAAAYGTMNPAEYARLANQNTLLACYCETRQAADSLPDILDIGGIDVIFIGPMDLSQSFGVTGNPKAPEVAACIDRVIEQVSRSDKAAGIISGSAQEAAEWVRRGVRFITISSDQGMVLSQARRFAEDFRRITEEIG